MTPEKFQALRECVNKDLSDGPLPIPQKELFLKWITQTSAGFERSGKTHAEPFRRSCVDAHMRFFSQSNSDHRNKTLIVAVTGAAQRMMMPLPLFLQHLDAANCDILLPKYPKGPGFRHGLPGFDQSFEGMLERLGSLPFSKYHKVVSIGTSGGALPALLLALRYQFHAGMCVGMTGPSDPRWMSAIDGGPSRLVGDLLRVTDQIPKVFLVTGESAVEDVEAASKWSQVLPDSKVLTISNPSHPVWHNALIPLIHNGSFQSFLHHSLFQH